MACVNKSLPAYKALVAEFGDTIAESLTISNKYVVPDFPTAIQMIRGTKAKQFAYAVRKAQTLTSPVVDDLLTGFGGIIRKVGDSYYLVSGSRISERPTPAAQAEVEFVNRNFLDKFNEQVAPLFAVEEVKDVEFSQEALDIVNANLETIQGFYKDLAQQDPVTFLNEVAKQALNLMPDGTQHVPTADDITRYGKTAEDYQQQAMLRAKQTFGENLVNEAITFYQSNPVIVEGNSWTNPDRITPLTGPSTVKEVLNKIIEESKKYADTARYILNTADEKALSSQVRVSKTAKTSYYDPVTGDVVIRESRADVADAMIHEIIHAAAVNYMAKNISTLDATGSQYYRRLEVYEYSGRDENAKELIRIYFKAVNALSQNQIFTTGGVANNYNRYQEIKNLPYGLLNLHEFLAEAFSNDDFKAAMQSIPYDENISLWDKFVNWLKNIFGIPVSNNLLDNIYKNAGPIIASDDRRNYRRRKNGQFYVMQGSEELSENKTGATQGFFSDVVTGKSDKFKAKAEWKSILPFTAQQQAFKAIYDTFKGNFDNHIATSIPTFRELQIKVGATLADMYKDGGLIYDIGGSEGGFIKAITKDSAGAIKSINLDVNEDMKAAHDKNPVEGSTFVNEAFLEAYTDESTNKTYPRHVPSQKADVVHESMVFQFISPERKQFIGEIKKNYIKPDGIVLLEEKVLPASEAQWIQNEKLKDSYKLQYYPQEAITAKAEQVLVGMKANQTAEADLVSNLKANFKYVSPYWDAGNFKGYIATDSKAKHDEFLNKLGGMVTSPYSSQAVAKKDYTNEKFKVTKGKTEITNDTVNRWDRITRRDTVTDEAGNVVAYIDASTISGGTQSQTTRYDYDVVLANGTDIGGSYEKQKDAVERIRKELNLIEQQDTGTVIAGKRVLAVATGQEFKNLLDAVIRKRTNDGIQITPNEAGYYQGILDDGGYLFAAEDGSFGAAVSSDGYMGAMFKDPALEAKVSKPLQELRIQYGGRYMDAYSTLEPLYVKNGFRPIARLEFDENAAAENWQQTSLKDRPDVVFFVYDPQGSYKVGDGQTVTSYEEGMNLASGYVKPVEEARVAPGNLKVTINENALAEFTKRNQENRPDDPTIGSEEPLDTETDFQKLGSEYWTREQKTRFATNNSIAMLSRKFGIKFETVNDPNTFWRGKFSNGTVVLNQAYMTPDTPFHELFHGIFYVLQNENPDLYNKILDEVRTTERGEAIFKNVQEKYPELSAKDQLDEAAVQMLGELSGAQALESKPIWKQFFDWLKSVVARMGIFVKDFRSDMSMVELADLILDPSFVMDLKKKNDFENTAERYSKVDPQLQFDEVMDRIISKLQADVNIPAKTETESTRKYFSGKQLEAFRQNRKDIKAIDGFVLSALSQTKEITEKFEKFKVMYDKKGAKSPADLKSMSSLLYEIENVLVLYDDLRPLINSMKEIFPDDAGNYGSLFNYLSRQDELIQGYRDYGLDIVAEWLMPYMKKGINGAKASGKLNKVVSDETFAEVNNTMRAAGITDPDQILQEAVKKELKKTIQEAKSDYQGFIGWFDLGLSGTTSSKDAVTQLVGISLVEEVQKALKKALAVKDEIKKTMRKVRGNVAFATEAAEKEFYTKYLRQVDSYEYQGLDKDGNEKYDYVKRWAFNEKYLMDVFYNAKREFMTKLGPRPPKNDPKAGAWEAQRKAWFDANTVTMTDAKGKVSYQPNQKYLNPQFDGLMQDEYYRTLYNAYKTANDKLGFQGLKYGIVPQLSKGKNLFTNSMRQKGLKGKLGKIASNLREGLGAEEQMYYAENIEGFERKTVPINYVRLLEEEDLSFNLADSVAKFTGSAFKYEAMRSIEPQVMVLRNFINGNAYLSLNPRKAQQTTSKGAAKLKKGSRELFSVEATRLNEQLNGFINDIVYGEQDERQLVKAWGSRFVVYQKDDVSNNGKPMKEVVKNFEDLKAKLNRPDLNYSDFKIGQEQEINGYVVKLANKDWNLSLNKVGNTVGLVTALQNMALNVNSLVMNVGIGNISSFVEASGGKYFGLKDWAFAQKEYFRNVFTGAFFEDTRGGKQSKIGQFLTHYDAFQGEFEDELGRKISAGVANRLLRRDRLFVFQKVGEHQIQSVGMIAQMRAQKVPTKSGAAMNLYDAWELDQDGNIKLKDDAIWSEEDDNAFRNTLQGVNKELNGNYSKLDKAKLQRIWWGRALMMFRKHIYNAFKARYGKEEINYERGTVIEGYYRTFWGAVIDELSEYVLNRKFRKLTDQEKYAMRKLAADLGVVLTLFALFKATDDDDEDNEINDNFAFWSRRLLSDTGQYAPVIGWLELSKIVRDPAASVNTVEKYYGALSQLITDPDAVYERDGPGYTKGELKWKVKMGKIVPVYRQWLNAQNPEDMLKFYKLNVKSLISAGSEKQNEVTDEE